MTATLYSEVLNTQPLTQQEHNVAKAYLALFGRSPDSAGLAYWSTQPQAATIEEAVNLIAPVARSLEICDPDNLVTVQMLYRHLLGKTYADDPGGINFWAGALQTNSVGKVVSEIISISETLEIPAAITYKNRSLVLESICRLQKAYNRGLTLQDSLAVILGVDYRDSSYMNAMDAVRNTLVGGYLTPTTCCHVVHSSQSLWSAAQEGSNLRTTLTWYTRGGNKKLATVYLPDNFLEQPDHKAVVALHGGGWRLGWPEQIEWVCRHLQAQGYVVVAPTYSLSWYSANTSQAETDVADMLQLVQTSGFLRCASASVGLLGESAGGHLACLVGIRNQVNKVFALYPPLDLTGSPAVSADLQKYVNYYAGDAESKTRNSPATAWTSDSPTRFNIWHGTGDALVPISQSVAFKSLVEDKCQLTTVVGEGHGFSAQTKAQLLQQASSWFAS